MISVRDEIIVLCQKINSYKCCPICGGSISFNTCDYCHNKIKELDGYIQEISTKLSLYEQQLPSDIFNNMVLVSLFNYLYSINRFQIPKVNEWLTKSNYKNLIDKELNTIILTVNNAQSLSEQNYKFIWFLMDNGLIDEKLKMNWLNLLMRGIAQKKLEVNEFELQKIIRLFSEEVMKNICGAKKPHCEIVDLEDCNGLAKSEHIYISNNLIKKAMEGDIFGILQTNFHEITHVKQYKDRQNRIISWFNIVLLKDRILAALPNYYRDNYNFLPSEAEAELEGIDGAISYMNFLELSINENELKKINEAKKFYSETIVNTSRKINDKYIELDEIFDKFIKTKPELLAQYPQLSLEYTIEDGLVRRKKYEEVSDDYKAYLNQTLELTGSDNEIKFYFEYLIKRLSETKLNEF